MMGMQKMRSSRQHLYRNHLLRRSESYALQVAQHAAVLSCIDAYCIGVIPEKVGTSDAQNQGVVHPSNS